MKTINLIIEPHEYKALDKACGYLDCEILQYKDNYATVKYKTNHELFRLGSLFQLWLKV